MFVFESLKTLHFRSHSLDPVLSAGALVNVCRSISGSLPSELHIDSGT